MLEQIFWYYVLIGLALAIWAYEFGGGREDPASPRRKAAVFMICVFTWLPFFLWLYKNRSK